MGTTASTEQAGEEPNVADAQEPSFERQQQQVAVSGTEKLPVPETIIIETRPERKLITPLQPEEELQVHKNGEAMMELSGAAPSVAEKRQSRITPGNETDHKKARTGGKHHEDASSPDKAEEASDESSEQVLPCGTCDLCLRPDCGHCEWCLSCARSTSLSKASCSLKVSSKYASSLN